MEAYAKYYNKQSAEDIKKSLEAEGHKVKIEESTGAFSREHTYIVYLID